MRVSSAAIRFSYPVKTLLASSGARLLLRSQQDTEFLKRELGANFADVA